MPKKPNSKDGWVKLQHARAYVQQNYPYFYKTLLGLIPEDVPGEGTLFVTDTMMLGIDMEWFSTLEVDVAAGCLIHEVMHILRGMYRIAQLPDQKRAGYAFDIPINDDLKRAEIKLPPWVVYSSTHNLPPGLTGEKYYELLRSIPLPPGLLIGSGRCGSCHTHDARKTKHPGRTPQEVNYFRKMGIQDLKEHIKNMHPGNVPGSWSELVDMKDAGPAIIPWQSIAKSGIHRAFGSIQRGQADFSLKHPSKRSCAAGFIRPGMVESAPEVVIIEDSSGSMQQEQLRENRVELINSMTQLGLSTLWFMSADTTVRTKPVKIDRKSTRLNSSHSQISYAVFCLKKKKKNKKNRISQKTQKTNYPTPHKNTPQKHTTHHQPLTHLCSYSHKYHTQPSQGVMSSHVR